MKITKISGDAQPLQVNEVEMREPLVGDLIAGERISGKTEGYEFAAAVISQVGKFDGKALTPEEVQRLTKKDFLDLLAEADITDPQASATESSTSSGKESSDTKE